jgi:hypothetical protein
MGPGKTGRRTAAPLPRPEFWGMSRPAAALISPCAPVLGAQFRGSHLAVFYPANWGLLFQRGVPLPFHSHQEVSTLAPTNFFLGSKISTLQHVFYVTN